MSPADPFLGPRLRGTGLSDVIAARGRAGACRADVLTGDAYLPVGRCWQSRPGLADCPVRVYLGSDHAGFELKTRLIEWLASAGHEPVDCGPASLRPRRRLPAVRHARGPGGRRRPGQPRHRDRRLGQRRADRREQDPRHPRRAGLDDETAQLARQHNDANVLSLGARMYATTRRSASPRSSCRPRSPASPARPAPGRDRRLREDRRRCRPCPSYAGLRRTRSPATWPPIPEQRAPPTRSPATCPDPELAGRPPAPRGRPEAPDPAPAGTVPRPASAARAPPSPDFPNPEYPPRRAPARRAAAIAPRSALADQSARLSARPATWPATSVAVAASAAAVTLASASLGLGVGQSLGVRPGHVPGPHRRAGRHLHRAPSRHPRRQMSQSPVSCRWTTSGTAAAHSGAPCRSTSQRRSLWRHRDFMLLWSGQTVSEMGSAVTLLALP